MNLYDSLHEHYQQDIQGKTLNGATWKKSESGGTTEIAYTEEAPRYKVLLKIDGGGFSTTYYGKDLVSQIPVAIKKYQQSWEALVLDPDAQTHLIAETVTQPTLQHPNIAKMYDVIHNDGYVYVIQEWIDGKNLDERSSDIESGMRRPWDRNEILHIADQVCTTSEWLYRKHRLLHRDIKPTNIMLTDEGTIKIIDLGTIDLIGAPRGVYTQHYAHPAIFGGYKPNLETETYSIATTLYYMLFGTHTVQNDGYNLTIQLHHHELTNIKRLLRTITRTEDSYILTQRNITPWALLQELKQILAVR